MTTQWPPRSPHEALLSSPGGRERMRRLAERQSPTPSPSKLRNSRTTGANDLPDPFADDMDVDEEEEEDEEMLQLKLQAIQARMKLKKLQAAKATQKKPAAAAVAASNPSATNGQRAEVPSRASNATAKPQGLAIQSKLAAARDRMESGPAQKNNPGAGFEVPASPVRKARTNTAELQTSPQRILLGIDKGRKATEMSLKRAPSMRKLTDDAPRQGGGGYLRRSNTVGGQASAPSKPLSFNERLAASRVEETSRQEKQKRIQQVRTKAFSVGKQEMEDYKSRAVDLPDMPDEAPEYTREDILAGKKVPRRSAEDPFSSSTTGEETASFEAYSGLHLSKRILPHKVLTRAITGKKTYVLKDLLRQVKSPDWSLPDVEADIVVFAIIANKSDPKSHRPTPGKDQSDRGKYMVITLVDLTYEVDLFLFNSGFDRFWKLTPGTVLAILNPNIMPPPQGREDTGRFGLVINSDEDTILEIGAARDLGYCKSVKKDGTLCSSWVNARRSEYCEFHTNEAIRKAQAGRAELNQMGFGGGERHKKNSKEVWLQKKKDAETKLGKYDRSTGSHYFVSRGSSSAAELIDDEGFVDRVEREEVLKRRLKEKERERELAKKLAQLGAGAGKDYMSRAAEAPSEKSSGLLKSRRRGESGSTAAGLGSSVSSGTSAGLASAASFSSQTAGVPGLPGQGGQRWDARALGLVGKRGDGLSQKVELGPPLKRKRPESSASSSTTTHEASSSAGGGGGMSGKNGAAYGWGSELRTKLGRMKEGERLDGRIMTAESGNKVSIQPSISFPPPTTATTADGGGGGRGNRASSPVRKKTRFVTDKGIREAGRESLGESLSVVATKLGNRRQVVLDDSDDDDLIVVK
ncbi:hypothetical protein QBC37DRAFT_415343 [Rhypophila decipiens]|uniref:Zinc finger Mcm10/DnaG-type domain-containing protein n=1 Tax=Rhypophila decipiens TaxID=261697 RepID=A0AAN6YIH4_9PEZI|nr:hypothetical protein QBC37DRAFT_415343 [Rhypophila decipiens]